MVDKPKQRISAEAEFFSDGHAGGFRARVPASVRDKLGARPGDTIIFEEGCEAAVTRAALLGPYFVVRLKRKEQAAETSTAADLTVAQSVTAFGKAFESLEESVRKKLRGE
jgi:bifunctional DNA-binding transcriptional regulator/antitoxin component of YhaV-PrlF toxin-antitoxin module